MQKRDEALGDPAVGVVDLQQVAYLVGAVGAGNQGPLKFEGLAEGEKASWLVDDLFWGKADADDTLWWPLPGGRKTPIGMQPRQRQWK